MTASKPFGAATDREALRYLGLFGNIVVLVDDHGSLETTDMARARQFAAEHAAHNPRIWTRTWNMRKKTAGKWRMVRP